MRHCVRSGIFIALLSLLAALPAAAQFNSNIQGTVSDPSGAEVPQAKVVLENTQLGVHYETQTNDSGFYRFNNLAPGTYDVTVQLKGFAKKTVAVTLTTNQTEGTNIALEVASASVEVAVTSEAPALDIDETRTQSTLNAQQIEQLPLQNGNVLAVLRTAPGVTGIDEDRNLWAIPIGNTTMNAQANGRPNTSNTFTLDGQSINSNAANGSIVLVPETDQVAEVAMETTTFAADTGAGSSARLSFTTKSGTNTFHGDAQMRYSSKGFVATPFLASSSAPFARKWYNGTLGGPVWKDHTFFFVSYLNQQQVAPLSSEDTVETPQFLQWAEQNFPNSNDVNIALAKFPPTALTVTNPAATLAGSVFTPNAQGVCTAGGQPIPCNLPFQESGVFNQSPKVNGWETNERVDHYFKGDKDRIYFNYFFSKQVSDFLWDRPGYDSNTPSNSHYYNGNYSHVFSATLTNEASFSLTQTSGGFAKESGDPLYHLIPFLTIGGGPFLFGTPGDSWGTENNYQIHDRTIWVHHTHSLKFGVEGTYSNYRNDDSSLDARPEAVFFPSWDAFLDDQPWFYSLTTLSAKSGAYLPQIFAAQVKRYGAYIQDDWKVRPNLFVSLGFRWDDFGNPSDYSDGLKFAQVFPGSSSSFSNPQQPQWIGPGEQFAEAISNTYVKPTNNAFSSQQWKNFLPRVGVAWSPDRDQKWSIRGGFGLYEDAISLPGVTSSLPQNSFNTLSVNESIFNPAPFNVVSTANLYGTTTTSAPYGYTYPSVTPLGFDSRGAIIRGYAADGTPLTYASNLNGVDPNLVPPKTMLYNFAIERLVTRDIVIGATYTGSKSWDQTYSEDYNTFIGDLIDNNGTQNRLTWSPTDQSQEWGAISYMRNGLTSNYNALIVTASQRLHSGLTWNANYTFGKALAYSASLSNPYDTHSLYGPADFDVRNRISSSLTYDTTLLDFIHRNIWRSALLGWQISGMGIAQSGTPFSVITTAPFNPSGNSPTTSGDFLANGVNYALPNIPANIQTSGWSREQYMSGIFPASDFTLPAGYGTQPVNSNQGYNLFRNPGYFSIDMSLAKKIVMPWFGEGKSSLILAVEGTNILNRLNLGGVNTGANGNPAANDLGQSFSNGTFGKATTANQQRIFQLRARFEF